MLYEISKELGTVLQSKGVPFPVIYGPERVVPLTMAPQRIVLERDRQGGDSLGPVRVPGGNPRLRGVRAIGAIIRVYAKSSLAGAAVHDHERLADQAVDKIFVALDNILRGARKTLWVVQSSKLLDADELSMQGLETWPGVVYEIRFSVDRGVLDTTWKGEARPEVLLGPGGVALGNTTKVGVVGMPAIETSCGCVPQQGEEEEDG